MDFFQSSMKAKDYYTSVFMESFLSNFWNAAKNLTSILNKEKIRFTFIGGFTRNYYTKVARTTEDLDILVDSRDKEKMENLPIGYIRDLTGRQRSFLLHTPKTNVDVLYSGESTGGKGLLFELPTNVSKTVDDLPLMTLENLIKYKLSSGIYSKRLHDFADVQVLIKDNNLKRSLAKENSFRGDLIKKYEEIWDLTCEGLQ